MFKKLLQLKTLLVVCLLAMVGTSNVWGQSTSTLTFSAKCNGSGTADDGVSWTVTSDGSESNFDNSKGIHYGTSSLAVQYIKLSTSKIVGTITSVVVNASTASGVSATVDVTVGGVAFGGNPQSLSTSAENYTFNGSASGEIVVTVTKPSKAAKALYVKSVAVTYTSGGTSTLTDNDLALTDDPVALSFDLYNNATAQVINYTTSSTGEVTVADNDYATFVVDQADKTITVTPTTVTPSTQTITVNQAANDTYAAGSVTFTLDITGTTPSGENWVETALADLTSTDVFVIVGNKGDKYYAMSNDNGTSSAPSAKRVNIEDRKITGTVADNLKWSIAGDATNGYSFCPNGSTTNFLYCNTTAASSSNNNIRVGGNGERRSFVLENNYLKTKDGNVARYVSVYDENGTSDWRGYVNTTTQRTTVKFYKRVDASAPQLSSSDVNIEYNATSGSISYSLVNPVSGGEVTATSSENWLTVGTIADNSVALSCEANSAATERVAEVTLTYTYNTNETVTKTVTVTQAANPDATMTIAEVRAQGTGTTVKTAGVVTSVNGKTAYIQDNNAAIVVYNRNSDLLCVVGDEITVEGTLSTYNGLLEITSPTVNVKSQNNTVTPEVMTIAQVNASTKQGWLVKIENATVTAIEDQNTTIAQGENSIIVHGISSEVEYGVNDALTLTGNIGCFNTVQIANPTDVVVAENEEPVINVSTTTIEVDAAGTSGTIDVTYDNITEVMAEVQFFESDGITPATCDWIEAEIDANNNNNVYYLIGENSGVARTAYLKVYALDDDANDVYSDLIVITQDAPVVDYASLPFDYDGNGPLPQGLTQNGLGTYDTSLKMKFDDTGDYLVLKLNEEPGALSYAIKGNSFSGGTFTVQTSSNGESFTDLATYTKLGDTQNEFLGSIPAGTRYIKWVYTKKSSGNVALGNIHVAKPITAKINAYGYGTFASDSAVMFSEEDENLTAWQVKGVDETEITFEQVTGNVAAGTGLLLKGSEGTITVTAANEGKDISATNKLVGITSATIVEENQYYGLSGNKFVKVNPGTVKAGKALLPVSALGSSSSVRTFTFVFVDPTTGISETQTVSAEQFGEIFNLAGQRIGQPQKGVNIINGKKVLVK